MKPPPDCKIAGTILGLLLAASSLNAQTSGGTAGSDEVVDPFGFNTETSPPLPAPTVEDTREIKPNHTSGVAGREADVLAECRATAESLRAVISQGFTCPDPAENPDLARLQMELQKCREDDRLNRKTNQRLNNDLQECRSDNGPSEADIESLADVELERDAARDDLAAARTALEEANEEIAALQKRLDSIGVGAEPGFRYAGSVDASYMRRDIADTNVRTDLKLPSDRCEEALAWLDTRTGTDLWLRKLVWVWDEAGDILLCAPTASSGLETTPASPSDEAHAIIFE